MQNIKKKLLFPLFIINIYTFTITGMNESANSTTHSQDFFLATTLQCTESQKNICNTDIFTQILTPEELTNFCTTQLMLALYCATLTDFEYSEQYLEGIHRIEKPCTIFIHYINQIIKKNTQDFPLETPFLFKIAWDIYLFVEHCTTIFPNESEELLLQKTWNDYINENETKHAYTLSYIENYSDLVILVSINNKHLAEIIPFLPIYIKPPLDSASYPKKIRMKHKWNKVLLTYQTLLTSLNNCEEKLSAIKEAIFNCSQIIRVIYPAHQQNNVSCSLFYENQRELFHDMFIQYNTYLTNNSLFK